MKKFILVLTLLLALPLCAQTGQHSYTFTATGQDPSVNGIIPLAGTGIGFNKLTWVVNGTLSGCAVQLDSSSNGSSWTGGGAIGTQACTANSQTAYTSGVFNYVTINVTTLTGTGSLTVTWNGATSAGGTTPGSTCGDTSHALGWSGTAYTCQAITGTATAGGSTTQLQWNNATALGGIGQFTTNGTTTITGGSTAVLDLHAGTVNDFLLSGSLATGLVTVATTTGGVSSVAAPAGTVVGTTDTQSLTNKTVDGVTPATMAFVDPTSSIQTQLNAKSPIASPTFTGVPAAPTAGTNINTTQIATTAWVNSFYAPLASPAVTGTATFVNLTVSGTCTGCGGSSTWSGIGNGSGNLNISPGGTSIFNTTTAANQFFAFKNTTAAVVGTSQGSPILSLCGTAFHGSASVEDCLTISELPGNGNDASITDNYAHTGSSTGPITSQFPGPLASGVSGSGVGGTWLGPEGTNPANVASNIAMGANAAAHELEVATNGSSSFGMLNRSQPGAIRSTALLGSVSTATLCAASAGSCNTGGTYDVHVAIYQSGTACTANSTGGISFQLTWTDGNGTTHSAQTLPLQTTATLTAPVNGVVLWTATTLGAVASSDFNIDTNGTIIQYATTFAQCTSGTATYALSAYVTRGQ